MMKTKGKIILTLLLTLIVGVLFATLVYAAPSGMITIEFYTSQNALDKDINTNDIAEGVASIERGQQLKLPTKTVSTGSSFNWRTEDGRAWEGGSTVTFYENTKLFPITAVDITTAEELMAQTKAGGTMRLLNDIYLSKKPDFPWPGTCTILLNGKTLEISSSLGTAWGGQRAGTFFYGTGTVKYAGSGLFANMNGHSWGGDSARLFVGRGVTIDAPKAILGKDSDGAFVGGYPRIQIYGTVNCKSVLQMGNAGNRYPRVEIYDGAQVTVNGPFLSHTVPGNNINVIISGGSITTTSATNSFFEDIEKNGAVFSITGGSFTFANADDYQLLQQTIDNPTAKVVELTGSDGNTYQTVILYSKCDHQYTIAFTQEADCNQSTHDNFFCSVVSCESHIRIAHGTKTDHKFTDQPTSHKNPTKITVGWDRYVCESCSCVRMDYIYYDPSNDEITVVVNTGSGEQSITVAVKDVYELIQDDNTKKYIIMGVTAINIYEEEQIVTTYEAEQIVSIYVPAGISEVKITALNKNSSIKTITFGAGGDITVTSLKGLKALENIVIENVSNLVFEKECANRTIKSIRSDVSGAKVEYKEQAFTNQATLTEMTFSKNSIYTFGAQCFKEIGVTSLEFVDGCRVSFSGDQAFLNTKIEYLYVGKGITSISGKPFENSYYLQKIILMDVTSISDSAFSNMNKGAKPCVVYHHAESLSLGNSTFASCHGISLYTKASITTGFASCAATTKGGKTYPAYTIYYGISHGYERIDTAPTCTAIGKVEFVTTCICGENKGTLHKVFEANYTESSTYTEVDYTNKEIEKLPHDLQSIGTIEYCDGYTKPGYFTYKCKVCRNGIKEGNATFPPLVICYGYSTNEADTNASFNVRYTVDLEALEAYEESNSVTLEFGSVVALKKSLGIDTPLDENGNARNGVIKLMTSKDGYSTNSIKLTNLNGAQKSFNFIMSLYIIDNGAISYIQDTETVENPSGVSYKEVKELADYYESLVVALPVSISDED